MTEAADTVMASIVWLDAVGNDAVAVVGGKGANLAALMRAQFPVPPGFVVSAGAYRGFLRTSGLEGRIAAAREALHDPQGPDPEKQRSAAAALREAIVQAPMPGTLAGSIRAAYTELGGGRVAVRSSGTAEDLAQASFAGQHETYLNVEGSEDVVAAVQRCWASLFTERAVGYRAGAYRAGAGFDDARVDLAVVVQRMVVSEMAGVLFTMHPVSGDRETLVIEAVRGLGESLVSGRVTPDHYEVDRATLAARAASGTGQPRTLEASQIVALGRLALRIEAHFNGDQARLDQVRRGPVGLDQASRGQDIEWAWAAGAFWILQARPVAGNAVLGAAP